MLMTHPKTVVIVNSKEGKEEKELHRIDATLCY
jgi:hypothetical protein